MVIDAKFLLKYFKSISIFPKQTGRSSIQQCLFNSHKYTQQFVQKPSSRWKIAI